MSVLSTLATIFGVFNGFANIPQIYKVFKTKSAKDLAVSTYIILAVGSFVWILYGIEIMNIPILTMNSIAFVEFILIIVACYLYGR